MARDTRRATVSTLPRVFYLAVVYDKLNAGLVICINDNKHTRNTFLDGTVGGYK